MHGLTRIIISHYIVKMELDIVAEERCQGKRIKKNQKEDKWRFSFDMVNDK